MKSFDLKGTVRTDLGKKATKAERVVDNVPCVLYGVAENVHFITTVSEIRKLVYTPEVFVVNLEIEGKVTKMAYSNSIFCGEKVVGYTVVNYSISVIAHFRKYNYLCPTFLKKKV